MATLGQLVANSKAQQPDTPAVLMSPNPTAAMSNGKVQMSNQVQSSKSKTSASGNFKRPAEISRNNKQPDRAAESRQPAAVTFRWVAETLASAEHPHQNEDAWFLLEDLGAAGIFDGVHSVAKPADSSRQAVKAIKAALQQLPRTNLNELPRALGRILEGLNGRYRETNHQAQKPQLATTATIALIREVKNQPTLIYGLVGDSRISIWHANTKKLELTVLDDGLLRMLLEEPSKRPGWIRDLLKKDGLDPKLTLTFEEAATIATLLDQHHDPGSVSQLMKILFAERDIVTQSLGAGAIVPHVGTIPLDHGDRVLLATDGIHDNLVETELTQMLATTSLDEVAAALIVRAHEIANSDSPRAKVDDLTALVIEIE